MGCALQSDTRSVIALTDYEQYIARRIGELRGKKNITARDMSLTIGQNSGYINSIENGKTLPSVTGLLAICEFLGVTPKEFFDVDNPNPLVLSKVIEELKSLDEETLSALLVFITKSKKAN